MPKELILLREEVPALQLAYNGLAPDPDLFYKQTGKESAWQSLLPSGTGRNNYVWFYQTEIDVSGWGVKGETFYPTGYNVQKGLRCRGFVGGYLTDDVLITQVPFDVENYVRTAVASDNILDMTLPALLNRRGETTLTEPLIDYEDVLGGIKTMFSGSTTLSDDIQVPVLETDYSSLEPTASDRLYLTRIIRFQNAPTPFDVGVMVIPACRAILAGMTSTEGKLQYIMRLKNSFKLTQTDVGLI